MPPVEATTFTRDFGRLQNEAHREVVKVTNRGRLIGAYLSAEDLAHFERLERRERRAYRAGKISDDLVEAIEKAEYLKPGV